MFTGKSSKYNLKNNLPLKCEKRDGNCYFEDMKENAFGDQLVLSTFGESHGIAIGGILSGLPAGVTIDEELIQQELDRRKPGQSHVTTARKESDSITLLSGVFEGVSTGAPIGFIMYNKDQRSTDYSELKDVYRPSHADYVYDQKFGIRDFRGGGRSSARETANWVAAGAIAKQFVGQFGVRATAYTSAVGPIEMEHHPSSVITSNVEVNLVRCPDAEVAKQMISIIEQAAHEGDSLGGQIRLVIDNVPVGLGEPIFDKLHARLSHAMMTINAVKGVSFGSGFAAAEMLGSEHNDEFIETDGVVATRSNHSGGIQGGISNGQQVVVDIAFKPVATIGKAQQTLSKKGVPVTLEAKGRHDPCVVPRAVPIVEGMAALVIADFMLINQLRANGKIKSGR